VIDHLAGLQPHSVCLLGAPEILWTMFATDLITAASYFAIPWALEAVRRGQSPSVGAAIRLFQLFIAACGMSHVFGAVTMFWPWYTPAAIVNFIMAAVSLPTAIVLWLARKRIVIR